MKNIFFYVIAAHLLIIAAVFYVHTPFAKTSPTLPLRTHTIVLNEAPKHELSEIKEPLPIEILSPPLENLLVSKKESAPKEVKPKETKAIEKKKPIVAAKPKKEASKASSSTSDTRLEQVAALMRQSLEKLESPSKTSSKAAAPPPKLSSLASESLSQDATYQHDLVAYLEDALEFPEKGKVRIKLSLKRDGGVQKLEIVETSSEKNKKFVETHIPALSFPPFGRNFGSEIVHTFSITLSSENSR